MRYILAFISFAFVFAGVFFLTGWFLRPHLPPVADQAFSVVEARYWETNWVGWLLGITLGGFSALLVLSKAAEKSQDG